jgi:hypothetical protein
MKKLVVLLICVCVLISGCGQTKASAENLNNDKSSSDSNIIMPSNNDEDFKLSEKELVIKNNFDLLLNQNKKPYELNKFINNSINEVTPELADYLVSRLIKEQKSSYNHYFEKLISNNTQEKLDKALKNENSLEFNLESLNKINDSNIIKLLIEVLNGGYRFYKNTESNMYTIDVDYDYLNPYKKYLSHSMNEYITLKQNQIYSIDHSKPLSQEWINFGENIIKLENFLKENKNFIFYNELVNDYIYFVQTYMTGDFETPQFDYNNKALNKEYLYAFEFMVNKQENTLISKYTNKYLKLLKNNNFKYNQIYMIFYDDLHDILLKEIMK